MKKNLFSFVGLFKKKPKQKSDLDNGLGTTEIIADPVTNVVLVKGWIKSFYIDNHLTTFTSRDLYDYIYRNNGSILSYDQLKKILYKLQSKNAIYKEKVVLSSNERHYNLYRINYSYKWI